MSLYSRTSRSVRCGSLKTQERNRSLMSFCFSRAAQVCFWLTTRSSRPSLLDRVVDYRGLHVEGEFQEPSAVGPPGAVF